MKKFNKLEEQVVVINPIPTDPSTGSILIHELIANITEEAKNNNLNIGNDEDLIFELAKLDINQYITPAITSTFTALLETILEAAVSEKK